MDNSEMPTAGAVNAGGCQESEGYIMIGQNQQPTIDELKIRGFREVEGDLPIRVQELTAPLIGVYRAKSQGTHSPIYTIENDLGKTQILGCTDLDSRMAKINTGTTVAIYFTGVQYLKNGNPMFRCKVLIP